MSQDAIQTNVAGTYNTKQQLFVRYFTAILIDLTVLNLFDEYWNLVTIDSFTISLLAAVLLQVLLKITLKIEHHIAVFFKSKSGGMAKMLRILSTWAVLFGSKFAILEAVNIAFGDRVLFSGPIHGVAAFIVVLIVMLVAEVAVVKFNKFLN
ncbi:MAG: hypothetical protein ACC653_08045 [Gammaproteobacteria bacterium]